MTAPVRAHLNPDLAPIGPLLAPGRALAAVAAALPDQAAAARALNAVLAGYGATPRLRRHGAGWRIVTRSRRRATDEPAAAAAALAVLVAADGWRRVKRCAVAGCERDFLDRTDAASRRYCRGHSRHSAPVR